MIGTRGSEKLMAAWKARSLTEDAIGELGKALEESPAVVRDVRFHGGSEPTGMSVSLYYSGDDVPWCGNDILFWLGWLRRHGGVPGPPRIIINGIPFPEEVFLQLDYGRGPETGPVPGGVTADQVGQPG